MKATFQHPESGLWVEAEWDEETNTLTVTPDADDVIDAEYNNDDWAISQVGDWCERVNNTKPARTLPEATEILRRYGVDPGELTWL